MSMSDNFPNHEVMETAVLLLICSVISLEFWVLDENMQLPDSSKTYWNLFFLASSSVFPEVREYLDNWLWCNAYHKLRPSWKCFSECEHCSNKHEWASARHLAVINRSAVCLSFKSMKTRTASHAGLFAPQLLWRWLLWAVCRVAYWGSQRFIHRHPWHPVRR
jgi:hypothetical protein